MSDPRPKHVPRAGVRAAALLLVVGVLGLLVYGVRKMDRPLPPELYDEEPGEQPREEILKRLVADRPADRWPNLVRQVADLRGGRELALTVLMASMDADPGAAEPVLAAYLARFPEPHWGPLWAIKLRIKQRRFDEAGRLFRQRRAQVAGDERERQSVLYSFLEYMTEAGQAVEGYAEADPGEADTAFRTLAGFLERNLDRTDADGDAARAQLRGLIAAHRGRAGETPWTAYYAGMLLQQEKKYEEAQRAYADAIRRLKEAGRGPTALQKAGLQASWEDRTWDQARGRRVLCLVEFGRWEQAYDECDPPEKTFNDLTQLFEGRKDWDALERLVARHRARVPGDPLADLWQGVADFGRGRYEEAIAAADRYLPAVRVRWQQNHRAFWVKFRSQVRLGRLDDARRTYDAEAKHNPNLIAQMLLAAKAGDQATVERMLAEAAKYSTDPFREYYADEDIGPLLRSEAFADVRRKYPPPDPAPGHGD